MFQTLKVKISQLKPNTGQVDGLPQNPRFIRDDRFKSLVKSIQDAPDMMELREIIAYDHNGEYVIIGGNMRYRALKELKYKETTIKLLAQDTPVEKLREFVIKDNEAYGQIDWDILANEWDENELKSWDVVTWLYDEEDNKDLPNIDDEADEEDEIPIDETPYNPIEDVLFPSNNEYEIPTLMKELQGGRVQLPITPWGANSRLRKDVNTYHFYVDDYRFEALWKDPSTLINSGVKAIVEPNCSCHDQTPIAYGLQLIYKKRWLARYCQEYGIKVFADLNVADKFVEYNKLGIPQGYNAFFTRGLIGWLDSLKSDLKVAQEISGLETPNLVVYGGGKEIEKFCQDNGLLYITDFINAKKI